MSHGNIKVSDIYRRTLADPNWQADNFVFRITRNLVKGGYCTRRHGMALWNLYQVDKQTFNAETLFVDYTYPALSESEACQKMDELGYVWIDPNFEGGEFFGQGYSDRWEKKGWDK